MVYRYTAPPAIYLGIYTAAETITAAHYFICFLLHLSVIKFPCDNRTRGLGLHAGPRYIQVIVIIFCYFIFIIYIYYTHLLRLLSVDIISRIRVRYPICDHLWPFVSAEGCIEIKTEIIEETLVVCNISLDVYSFVRCT